MNLFNVSFLTKKNGFLPFFISENMLFRLKNPLDAYETTHLFLPIKFK